MTFLNPESLPHEELVEQYNILSEQFNILFDNIQEVRKLHKEVTHIYRTNSCAQCGQEYPCRTIKKLNGEREQYDLG